MNVILSIIALLTFIVAFITIIVKVFLQPKYVKNIHKLYAQGKYNHAIRIAKQVIAKDPKNAAAHYFLGLCYEAEQMPELAFMELKAVNRIGQFNEYIDEVGFRKKIADLYLRFNQTEEALKEYLLLTLVQNGTQNAEYFYLIGTLFEKQNRTDKAMLYYKKAINTAPNHANSYARLGSIMFRAKRIQDARTYLEKATRLDPTNALGNFNLGKILRAEKDYSAALLAFEISSRNPELEIKSIVERGSCYLSMMDLRQAEPELRRAINLSHNPDSAEVLYARYSLASLFETTRKIEEAIKQWEEIFKVNEKYRDVAQKLANFQGLRTSDVMKDFLTSSGTQFVELCREIIASMNFIIVRGFSIPDGCQFIVTEDSTKKWQNSRQQHSLLAFMRTGEPIVEGLLRVFHDEMKTRYCSRGMFFTSSTFSKLAQTFAENRPIELVNRAKLQKILMDMGK